MSKIIKSVLCQRKSPVVIKHRPLSVPEPVVVPEQQSLSAPPPEIDLEAIRSEAEAIMTKAQTTATRCLSEAESKAKEITQQAYDEAHGRGHQEGREQGYQEGYNQGNQTALADMQQTMQLSLEKAQHLIQTAEQEVAKMFLDAERQIVEIALAIASKILAREIADNPTTILPILKEALDKVSDQDQITIRVNPEDYEMVLMAKRDLQLMLKRDNTITITADHTVALGGCTIETALGTVDARLDTKLELVHKALEEVLP
ncbi:V-type proton ATPase subunit E [Sporomusa silvacetica DSM 10669]|uniref:V-type proton ATPase subunit E n=1 Tax=Sporomusa silvacetica DSM 10669 TaxID=1123289 RepID=A0ABZ3IKE2_9FIRM|nr:FliH/SctL family protein [Sporomusa silvacetica]OZC13537.1 Yop protein translocation protein L [Sporomusa silvacetica DSM 10669]